MSEVRNPMTKDPAGARELAKEHSYIRNNVQTRSSQINKPGTGPRNRFEKGVAFTKEMEKALTQELIDKGQDN